MNPMQNKGAGFHAFITKLGPHAVQFGYIVLANLCYVSAVQLFFLDNNIAAGGFAGIATVLNHIFPVSVGVFTFLMNIPLVLVSFKVFGLSYTIKIFVCNVIYTLLDWIIAPIPVVTHDRFAAAVFGGVLYALGSVFIINGKTSGGGSDLLARLLLTKFRNLSLGKMFLLVDGAVVIFAILVYRDIESGVYAITAIAVCSYLTDQIVSGFNVADICYIVTNLDPGPMGAEIMEKMEVGVTLQRGEGMYAKTPRNVLMVVVRPKEIHRLKEIVVAHDPDAFVVVAWASEVMGGGFRNRANF